MLYIEKCSVFTRHLQLTKCTHHKSTNINSFYCTYTSIFNRGSHQKTSMRPPAKLKASTQPFSLVGDITNPVWELNSGTRICVRAGGRRTPLKSTCIEKCPLNSMWYMKSVQIQVIQLDYILCCPNKGGRRMHAQINYRTRTLTTYFWTTAAYSI